MNKTYIFDIHQPGGEKTLNLTVIHCGLPNLEPHEIRADLQHHFDIGHNLPPDQILFLGTKACEDLFSRVISSDVLGLHQFTRNSLPPPLKAAYLDEIGELKEIATPNREPISPDLLANIQHNGLLHMFKERGALLESGDSFHYVKPSEKHCAKFIRTANVLSRGPETAFVAFCILMHSIRTDVRYIYVDTSSIAALAYVLALSRIQLNPSWHIPVVDSYGSHRRLSSVHFENPSTSLFLVSASTSGDLERRLIHEKHVPAKNIVTIFYLGEKALDSVVLCDVTRRSGAPLHMNGCEEFAPSFVSGEPDSCALCLTGSRPLSISGDQFLREETKTRESVITYQQKPRWLDRAMRDFYGRSIISCNKWSGIPGEEPREIFFDVATAIKPCANGTNVQAAQPVVETAFKQKLDRLIRQVTPASLRVLIHMDDPTSKALANEISRVSELRSVPLVSSKTVLRDGLPEPGGNGAIMITSGAVVAGQRLMEISQALRMEHSPIIYFVGLSRTRDEARLEEIKSNLRPTTGGPSLFYSVEELYIPDDPPWRSCPWKFEIETLKRTRDALVRDRKFYEIASNRIKELGAAPAYSGLIQNLFWPAIASGDPLRLRPGFALWSFAYSDNLDRRPSQADVYATISATLHNWRAQNKPASGELVRNVLSPRNFIRFNDGIIQASILRAAYPGELDYRDNHDLGAAIGSVLRVVFQNYDDLRGEACVEFLLAIAEGRLLLDSHIVQEQLDPLEKRLKQKLKSNKLEDTGYFALSLTKLILRGLEGKKVDKKGRR